MNATSLAVDGSGNVYVTGYSTGSGQRFDYATIKYNSSGVQQWVARYNGPGNSIDYANSLAVDGSGNVYVTGISDGSGTGMIMLQ
ncbi:MAG: SBBP repeat-containing protein [Ignavibacteria bacterium]|nr:SBBP repeat-containing protein [Ignavibacteria bacterium]